MVLFTAAPTTYEVSLRRADVQQARPASVEGTTTIGDVTFTLSQRQVVLALAEPLLAGEGGGMGEIPTTMPAG